MEVRWKTVNGYMTGEAVGERGNYLVVKLKNGKQMIVRIEDYNLGKIDLSSIRENISSP